MSDFLKLIESYSGGASTGQIFAGDGTNLSRGSARRMQNPKYAKAFEHFEEAYGNMLTGHRSSRRFIRGLIDGDPAAYHHLGEALSTSDFPLLFGDTIDRILLGKYKAIAPTWQDYIKVSKVADFRDVKRFKCSPGRGLLPAIGQGKSYEADKPSELHYAFNVGKYGGVRNIFWEVLINDDLQALQDTPGDFAYQAQQTESYLATALFADNTTLYGDHVVAGATYANLSHLEFSADNLAAALSAMGEFPGDDSDGTPVMNDPVYIVVGTKAMQLKVDQVLNSLIVAYAGVTDKANLPTANIISTELRSRMKVRHNPFLRMLDTAYQSVWYLFAEPADGYAVELAYLSGYEAPQLFMRASSQVLLGGGMASEMDGGFDNDAVDYKVRIVIGGSHTNAVGGWRFTYRSDGVMS